MITKMIMVHFLVILHWLRKLQISQWKMQCLRMEDVIRSDHSKLWHFWTEKWDYLRSRVTKSLLLNLSFLTKSLGPRNFETKKKNIRNKRNNAPWKKNEEETFPKDQWNIAQWILLTHDLILIIPFGNCTVILQCNANNIINISKIEI